MKKKQQHAAALHLLSNVLNIQPFSILQQVLLPTAQVCLDCEGPAWISACLLQIHLLGIGFASPRQLRRGKGWRWWMSVWSGWHLLQSAKQRSLQDNPICSNMFKGSSFQRRAASNESHRLLTHSDPVHLPSVSASSYGSDARWWMWPMAVLLWSSCCAHEPIQNLGIFMVVRAWTW